MSESTLLTNSELYTANVEAIKKLKGIDASSVDSYAKSLAASEAGRLDSNMSSGAFLFYETLDVTIQNSSNYSNQLFHISYFDPKGSALANVQAKGNIYTTYGDWDDFFSNVNSFYYVGSYSGILLNWFADKTLVGHFEQTEVTNDFAGLTMGGAGEWKQR